MWADLLETRTSEPTLVRVFDADRLNYIANHPDVRPTCGGDGKSYLDLSGFVANHKNCALVWEHGSFLFSWTAPQTYMVDIAVLPEGRGREAYRMARRGIAYIVAEGAERIWALVSPEMKALRHYASAAGFEPCGSDEIDIGFGPVSYDLYQWKKPCLQR